LVAVALASIREIEREVTAMRVVPGSDAPYQRTSVMTHTAWVPREWLDAARDTLAGLADRHPSRTILLVPRPDDEDGLDARVSLQRFRLPGEERYVCSEVIELNLRGRRAEAPASIVLPLLIPDLPVFLRWRGRPPFGSNVLDQLVDVVDRLVVDSLEWREPGDAFRSLVELFDRTMVSDIAWARTLPWRVALAKLWPGIADLRELRVAGPESEALLLAGWLRARLRRDAELVRDPAGEIERVAVDGEDVSPPSDRRSASELLSDELDCFSRDPVYEDAVRAASRA
jgi:glucose-6-phosphate dehydrogenase assembly protein OpcA